MPSNLETVQAMYDAFDRGDIPFILSCFADNIEWDTRPEIAAHGLKLMQPRQGVEEAAGFFQMLHDDVDFERFEIKKLFDGGDSVVVWLSVKFTYKPTGKAFEDTYCLSIWEFDADGKVLKYTQAEDTHGLWITQGGK
eukprot:TRINITY_DN4222_c0_g1_i1.p2 TRINITY_DN4222_c0_g1~~TRINITY_DN4222_c0_g1_i1.p2  ORF type:complete len:138 (-),score=55.43 TRINITY_DN4222_c0_g1_i1:436-849(-)